MFFLPFTTFICKSSCDMAWIEFYLYHNFLQTSVMYFGRIMFRSFFLRNILCLECIWEQNSMTLQGALVNILTKHASSPPSGFPTGVENMGGCAPPYWGGGVLQNVMGEAYVNTLGEHGEGGGLKMLSKNTCEGVHLIINLLALSLQACKFTKNDLLHIYFSRILVRF